MARRFRFISGLALILVGLILIPLPIVPGVPLILVGVALLDSNNRIIRYCNSWLHRWTGSRRRDRS